MDATQIAMYAAGVITIAELIKFSRYIPDRHGLLVAAITSALAVGLHIFQYGFQQAQVISYAFGWITILASASGVYGFVRETHPTSTMQAKRDGGFIPPNPAILLVFALGAMMVMTACAGRAGGTVTPDQRVGQVTDYATESAELAAIAQRTVNSYARGQGGRTTETDAVTKAIQEQYVPAARRLETTLKAYAAATSLDVRTSTEAEIKTALESYEKVAATIFDTSKLPPGLTTALAETTINVRKLILNIRNLFNFAPAPVAAAA